MAEHKDVILFATADWDTPYWTNKQHTARTLSARGKRVLYIESVGLRTPRLGSSRDLSRLWRRLKRGLSGIREVEKNIWVLSPLLIPFKQHWRLVRMINQKILQGSIARFMKSHAFVKPVVWTYHPFMLSSLPPYPLGPLVYHCVDDLAAIPGIDGEVFNAIEQELLTRADIVFTTSPLLRDKCLRMNSNVYDFPNVADRDHFRKAHAPGKVPPDLQAIPQPRIGYIGVLSDFKVDFALVLAVAQRMPEWHWVFIGEEREGQKSGLVESLRALANVHFLGFKEYNALPDYLRGIDVATLPSLINDYTRSMFPMKYFEYLAAGIPIVSTPLSFTRDHSAGMEIASNAQEFIRAIALQLKRGKLSPEESVRYVGDNTWDARLAKMLASVEKIA